MDGGRAKTEGGELLWSGEGIGRVDCAAVANLKEIKNVQPPMRSYHVSPFVVATDDCCCCWPGFFLANYATG